MTKLTAVVMGAVVLAGCASTSGWRGLRIDASSESTFEDSVALIQQQLPSSRSALFALALQDIWISGSSKAARAQEYTAEDYFRQLDGLGYKEVVSLAEATGLLRYTYSPRRQGVPSNVSLSGPVGGQSGNAHGWGSSQTDPFDPSPSGWRPSP